MLLVHLRAHEIERIDVDSPRNVALVQHHAEHDVHIGQHANQRVCDQQREIEALQHR